MAVMHSISADERLLDLAPEDRPSCTTYSPDVSSSKPSVIYKQIILKGRFRDPSSSVCASKFGPGPCSHVQSARIGGSASPKTSIKCRHEDSTLFIEATNRPGPGSYNVIPVTGLGKPAFTMPGRAVPTRCDNSALVGVGQYNIKGVFDQYSLIPFSMSGKNLAFSDEDILKIYHRFRSIDESKDGLIEIGEITRLLPDLADNPLTARVLAVFDKDKNGKVSFKEFVFGLARVASDHESKTKFLFDVYDMDQDGFVSNSDLLKVLQLMCGSNLTQLQLRQLIDRTIRDFDKDMDGKLSFAEFQTAIQNISLENQLDIAF